jgi:hypothetical protein
MTGQVQQGAVEGLGVSPNSLFLPPRVGVRGLKAVFEAMLTSMIIYPTNAATQMHANAMSSDKERADAGSDQALLLVLHLHANDNHLLAVAQDGACDCELLALARP